MQLDLAQPLWLLLGIVPLLGRLHRASGDGRRRQVLRFADPWLLPRLLSGRAGDRHAGKLFLLAWLLACIALSAPYLRATAETELRTALDIAIVLDISPSMQAQDVAPTRLQRAKWELEDFLRASPNDRRGLVVFSANAYVVLPLTPDREVVRHFLAAVDTHAAARRGSSLGLALERAMSLLAHSRAGSRAIVLVSDGENHDGGAMSAAREAARAGIPLLILGVGTEHGAPVPDSAGAFEREGDAPVISRLARGELQTMAETSNGVYVDLRQDDSDWAALTTRLDALARDNPYSQAGADALQLFPWFVAASVALFLWWGRASLVLAALVVTPLAATLTPSTAQANPWQEHQALKALQRNDLDTSANRYGTIDSYNAHLGRGVIAYRRGDFRDALSAFDMAITRTRDDGERARAHYNAGNALARLDHLDEAAKRYRAALHLQPNYPRAALNLNLVSEQHRLRLTRERSGEPSASLRAPRGEGAQQPDGAHLSRDNETTSLPSPSARGAPRSQTNAPANLTASLPPATGSGTASLPAPDSVNGADVIPPKGAANGPILSPTFSVQENVAALLQQRFRRLDSAQGIPKRMEKPW